MGIEYKVSETKLLEIRNKIFIESGVPSLEKNGFTKSPLSTAWFGKNNLADYTYELCRVSGRSELEIVKTHISKGDRWIKIHLNIFELQPPITSIEQLKGVDGLQFGLPPNVLTNMRLRSDDIKGMPLFNYHFMFGGHRLKRFRTEKGLNRRIAELGKLIKEDLTNINYFVKRWHELHQPLVTDWSGNKINN